MSLVKARVMMRFVRGRVVALACGAVVAGGMRSSVLCAQTFEGAIAVRLSGGGRSGPTSQEVEYLARGGNVRLNIMSPAGAMAILGLSAENKTYLVVESQRAYMELPPVDAARMVAASAGATKLTRSGRKETIAGYECEHVIVPTNDDTKSETTDMCLTYALGKYVNPMASLSGARLSPWQQQLAADGGFPLRVTLPDGLVALEVTKIMKRRVSDTLFRIPADFSKMELPKRP